VFIQYCCNCHYYKYIYIFNQPINRYQLFWSSNNRYRHRRRKIIIGRPLAPTPVKMCVLNFEKQEVIGLFSGNHGVMWVSSLRPDWTKHGSIILDKFTLLSSSPAIILIISLNIHGKVHNFLLRHSCDMSLSLLTFLVKCSAWDSSAKQYCGVSSVMVTVCLGGWGWCSPYSSI
jgi:hypothetical protein